MLDVIQNGRLLSSGTTFFVRVQKFKISHMQRCVTQLLYRLKYEILFRNHIRLQKLNWKSHLILSAESKTETTLNPKLLYCKFGCDLSHVYVWYLSQGEKDYTRKTTLSVYVYRNISLMSVFPANLHVYTAVAVLKVGQSTLRFDVDQRWAYLYFVALYTICIPSNHLLSFW